MRRGTRKITDKIGGKSLCLLSVLLLLLPSSFSPANAYSPRARFEVWNTDHGLPQNSVNAILQTREGYLWFSTLAGLVRYDGVRFTVFDKVNSKGIKSNRLTVLFEDRAGDLWFGTEDSGLTRCQNGTFTTFTTTDGLPGNWVRAIESDERGNPVVLTGEGIAQWSDGHFTSVLPGENLPLASDTVWHAPSKGGVTFFDHNGLYRFTEGQLVTYTTKDGLSSTQINSVYQDQHGTLWIGTKDRGLNRLKDGKFTAHSVLDDQLGNNVKVMAACEDAKGNLWIATPEGGLSRLSGGTLTAYSAADGLPSNEITAIYEDREGSIWVGTSGKGLYRFREEVITAYSERDGLSANNIYPIYEDRAGIVWVGAWPGLYRYKDGIFTQLLRKNGEPFNLVSALFEDAEGALWIGTYGDGGLTRLKDGKFTQYTTRDGLAADVVLAIRQDRAGNFWFGTTAGLNKFRDGVFTTYTTKDGLAGNEIKTIYEDREGALWVGSIGGLSRFKDGTCVAYTERDGLSGQHVRAIYEDADGVLWVGTYDGGLNRLKDGRFTSYTMRDGLFDNGVFRILEDDRGNFWMSSNRGIYRVSRRELNDFAEGKKRTITSISYGKNDGLLNAECNGGSSPAGWKARDGRLWFPTQEGVAVIDPKSVRTNQIPPPVIIEEVTVDNKNTSFGKVVEFSPGQARFEIRYTGLSFIKPEQVRFKFKLEGLDEDWVEAGGRRTAYYSYLPPGRYTFRVIAANSDGVWNTEGATIQIVVHPPFWRTWWFFFCTLFSIALLTVFGYQRHIAKLKRAHAAQEEFSRQLIDSQEGERQRIAVELHDSLGQDLLVIKNWALLGLSMIPTDGPTREQLSEITETAARAIEEVREIAYDLRPYHLDELGLTKAIESILTRVSQSSSTHFTAEIDSLDGVFSKKSEINFYRIIQESISNMVKHANATKAEVFIKRDEQSVRLIIRDNGSGFNPATITSTDSQRRGFGLIGMNERARMLGGRLIIYSAPGQGTTLTMTLKP